MGRRKQNGLIVQIGGRWFVRYWEYRARAGQLERKRVSHPLGPVTTRGKRSPREILDERDRYMLSINCTTMPADRVVTLGEFAEQIYLPWVELNKRPSTSKGYRDVWERHLRTLCSAFWLKNVRTFHVQQWLDTLGGRGLSRNTLKRIKSVASAIFTLAKQQDFFHNENPVHGTSTNPHAAEPRETHAYTLEEIDAIIDLLPEPSCTVFAVAAFTGLRFGEIHGLRWSDYQNGQLNVSRSIWNGKTSAPKTRKSSASIPVIQPLAKRLEQHKSRSNVHEDGPVFANIVGKPQSLGSLLQNQILPALNRCAHCAKPELKHSELHPYERDQRLPKWHGWHAARRGLGSNLYRMGIPAIVIQAVLRHSNVSTTAHYYIKPVSDDVKRAMTALEKEVGGQRSALSRPRNSRAES